MDLKRRLTFLSYAVNGNSNELVIEGVRISHPDRVVYPSAGVTKGDDIRVAGENAVLGDTVRFPGTIGSGICKVFDFTAASTGLSERRAR